MGGGYLNYHKQTLIARNIPPALDTGIKIWHTYFGNKKNTTRRPNLIAEANRPITYKNPLDEIKGVFCFSGLTDE